MTIILHISKNDGYCHFCEYSPGSQFSLSWRVQRLANTERWLRVHDEYTMRSTPLQLVQREETLVLQ